MVQQNRSLPGGIGQLSYRPDPGDGLIPRTLAFIREQLPAWRDDPTRPDEISEKPLNSSLCDFLDGRSRSDPGLSMARFKHEAPQVGKRTVDIGVHGTIETTLIGVRPYSKYEPFLVIEAKRLPTAPKKREQEYVTGTNDRGSATGGIQRFKLGLHGHNVETAAMVGYIQEKPPEHWHVTINGWIAALATRPSSDGCIWSDKDQLQKLEANDETGLAVCNSSHERTGKCVTRTVTIHHFWVSMGSPECPRKS